MIENFVFCYLSKNTRVLRALSRIGMQNGFNKYIYDFNPKNGTFKNSLEIETYNAQITQITLKREHNSNRIYHYKWKKKLY